MPESLNENSEPRFVLWLLYFIRRNFFILVGSLGLGFLIGLVVYFLTPTVYQAKGSFLVDKLPFGLTENNSNDAQTQHELVQSLILSIASEEMRKKVAQQVGTLPTNIAFADLDLPVSFSINGKKKANITVSSARNSRVGTVTVESADPEFAASVVSAIFNQVQVINRIAGSLIQIDGRLKLDEIESGNLESNVSTISAERIKIEQQNQALDQFIAHHQPLESFPAFAQDQTLSNLKTQYILVKSEYDAIAAQVTLGARLDGKTAELKSLSDQIQEHLNELVSGLRSSLQVSETSEAILRQNLNSVQQKMAQLQVLDAHLSQGFGNFNLADDDVLKANPDLLSEASAIVIIDPAYAIKKPIRPSLMMDLILGLLFGLGCGLSYVMLHDQVFIFLKNGASVDSTRPGRR